VSSPPTRAAPNPLLLQPPRKKHQNTRKAVRSLAVRGCSRFRKREPVQIWAAASTRWKGRKRCGDERSLLRSPISCPRAQWWTCSALKFQSEGTRCDISSSLRENLPISKTSGVKQKGGESTRGRFRLRESVVYALQSSTSNKPLEEEGKSEGKVSLEKRSLLFLK